jgi:hypothetical protein
VGGFCRWAAGCPSRWANWLAAIPASDPAPATNTWRRLREPCRPPRQALSGPIALSYQQATPFSAGIQEPLAFSRSLLLPPLPLGCLRCPLLCLPLSCLLLGLLPLLGGARLMLPALLLLAPLQLLPLGLLLRLLQCLVHRLCDTN